MMPAELPIHGLRGEILRQLEAGPSLVITAPTGAGKSTQVPQFLLGSPSIRGRVLVLQPRRLAARVLAERVASELGEPTGRTVGYRTRFEHCGSASTRLWFLTEGLLPRLLLDSPALDGVGAVVFDEFHERRLTADICLGVLRGLQRRRPELRLVVMSATLDAESVCVYLGGCPHLHAEGRQHPIDIRYAERPAGPEVWNDAARAAAAAAREHPEGDLLVFLPGVYEIRRTLDACRRLLSHVELLPLYGDLPPDAQHRVMEPGPRRRVILATNIAETSLTVPGVRHVVDSGLARVSRYDAGRGIDVLELTPISRDAADQRAGRAGREGPGTCRRLWTLAEQQRKPARTLPEVLRVDLAEGVLLLAALGVPDPAAFEWFERPGAEGLDLALTELRDLALISATGFELTALGRDVARVPAHPRLGRFLRAAALEGCLEEAAVAAAVLGERPLIPAGTELRPPGPVPSDLLAVVELARQARAAGFRPEPCAALGVFPEPARQVWAAARVLLDAARRLGWAERKPSPDRRDPTEAFARSVLAAFPDRLARRRDAGTLICELRGGRRGELVRASGARDAELLVAAEVREVGGRGRPVKTLLSMATAIREEWLMELFPDAWQIEDRMLWDEHRRQVVRRIRTACLGVTLEDRETDDVDPEKAAGILAAQVGAGRLPLHGWSPEVDAWIGRVRWLAGLFPERGLPAYDEADRARVVQALCAGVSRYRDIKDKPCLEAVRGLLRREDVRFVEEMAPAWVPLPNGRRLRIAYQPGQAPRARARIQELYDLGQTPRVAGGRVPVLLEILAPNLRTVQITEDLAGFWREGYPRAKKELARRYPRHEWR